MTDSAATPISAEVAQLEKYLQDRAIPTNPEFLERAGIEYAGAEAIADAIGFHIPHALGLLIHYPGTEYTTARLVPGGPRCPKGGLPQAYLSRWVDWPKIEGTLVLCESPLKALTWSGFGFNALSAGGTTTIYMPRRAAWCGGFPHAAIESGAIHTVLIAFDSDTEGLNHNVSRDLRTLARALTERHPEVKVQVHVLPAPPEGYPDEKWGCDDAHKYHGAEWFSKWAADPEVRREPERDLLQQHFDELDDRYIMCNVPPGVVRLDTGTHIKATEFKGLIEVSRQIPGERRPVPVAPMWLARGNRPEVEGYTYQPGKPMLTGGDYNNWREGELLPRKGDVTPWLDLINDAVKDVEVRTRMVECMAFQVQHRGTRLPKLLYFVGRQMGTGKSTQAVIMAKILGKFNSCWAVRDTLESQYNEDWAAKELSILDDIEVLKGGTWARIKTQITSDTVNITQKYAPGRDQENYTVFYISANQSDIIKIDPGDRRVLMINFEPDVVHTGDDDPYWAGFYHWLETGGYEYIAFYLSTYDLEGFNPHFHPPMTAAKAQAEEATISPEVAFYEEFNADPYSILPKGRLVFTNLELWMLYSGSPPEPNNERDRQQLLRRGNAKQYLEKVPGPRSYVDGKRVHLYWASKDVAKEHGGSSRAHLARNIKKYPITL